MLDQISQSVEIIWQNKTVENNEHLSKKIRQCNTNIKITDTIQMCFISRKMRCFRGQNLLLIIKNNCLKITLNIGEF